MAWITLLTDFGLRDTYVGVMHGVIAARCPQARVIDLCHGVRAQQVAEAGFLLERAFRYFPAGTIHVAVVDPGVGGERAIVAVEGGGYRFLAPDNGLLTEVVDALGGFYRQVYVTNPDLRLPRGGNTFHGRDIFAPAAAFLAGGGAMEELGPPCPQLHLRKVAAPQVGENCVAGQVVYIDVFGNLVTNIPSPPVFALNESGVVCAQLENQTPIPLRGSYDAVEEGQPVAVIGGFDRVEIGVRNGNAQRYFGIGLGAPVKVFVG